MNFPFFSFRFWGCGLGREVGGKGGGWKGRWVEREVGGKGGGWKGRWVEREVGGKGGGWKGRWVERGGVVMLSCKRAPHVQGMFD